MELGWFPQRKMGVLLAEEVGKDAGQTQLQASSFAVEQGDSPLKVIRRLKVTLV